MVSVVPGSKRGRYIAAVILFLPARGLSHTPTAPKGGETGGRIRKIRSSPRRLHSVYPRTDLAGRSSPRKSPVVFFPLPLFLPSLRRARLREPQQQCSAVIQSRECAMDVAERMLRSRGEKGDCGYIREACTIPPVFMA